MSEPLTERLRVGLMAVAALVRGNSDAKTRLNDALDAIDAVAELEAERDKLKARLDEAYARIDYLQDAAERKPT